LEDFSKVRENKFSNVKLRTFKKERESEKERELFLKRRTLTLTTFKRSYFNL